MGLIYQEVCWSNISSGIFKFMKIDPRKKWLKFASLSLDRSRQILLSRLNEEAQHKLDLSRIMISEL